MQEAVEEELAFWAELGWTSNRRSCGVEWRRIHLQLVVWRQEQGGWTKLRESTGDEEKSQATDETQRVEVKRLEGQRKREIGFAW